MKAKGKGRNRQAGAGIVALRPDWAEGALMIRVVRTVLCADHPTAFGDLETISKPKGLRRRFCGDTEPHLSRSLRKHFLTIA